MFDKRLFQLAPGLKKLIAGKVALMWVGLLANIGFMLSLVMLLNSLLTAVAPPLLNAAALRKARPAPCRCLIGTARMCCPWLATL